MIFGMSRILVKLLFIMIVFGLRLVLLLLDRHSMWVMLLRVLQLPAIFGLNQIAVVLIFIIMMAIRLSGLSLAIL
ncbi:uncharacterized protein METZ01_LOCUS338892 [marine metagenome]|uniref:Uncharacterized protein n=1 Tax=marine metagenome TaxID=408172 RepID=A0A382QM66_9ZZZZ